MTVKYTYIETKKLGTMIDINTGQNVAILAEQEIARLIARQPARDGGGKKKKQSKKQDIKRRPKQQRLAI